MNFRDIVLKIRKIILKISAFSALITMMMFVFINNMYLDNLGHPNLETGNIFPYKVKGGIVYLTENQNDLVLWITWILIISYALIFISLVLGKKWPTNKT
jgi:hypothetical protein